MKLSIFRQDNIRLVPFLESENCNEIMILDAQNIFSLPEGQAQFQGKKRVTEFIFRQYIPTA